MPPSPTTSLAPLSKRAPTPECRLPFNRPRAPVRPHQPPPVVRQHQPLQMVLAQMVVALVELEVVVQAPVPVKEEAAGKLGEVGQKPWLWKAPVPLLQQHQ